MDSRRLIYGLPLSHPNVSDGGFRFRSITTAAQGRILVGTFIKSVAQVFD